MKSEQKELLLERLNDALADMYHNAKNRFWDYAEEDHEEFWSWFEKWAYQEVSYLNEGGPYMSTDLSSVREYFEGQYSNVRTAWKKFNMYKNEMERAYANSPVFKIINYGKLYTWGRSGGTLAPENLVRTDGGTSFSIVHFADDELPVEEMTEMCLVVEDFNKYVSTLLADVGTCWEEYLMDKSIQEESDQIAEFANMLEGQYES